MNTGYLFQNVNMDSISFINNKNDIKFTFLNSYNGDHCGDLLCINVVSYKMDADLGEDKCFPKFVIDIISEILIRDSQRFYNVKFEGGDYYIEIVCQAIEIISKILR